MQKILIQKLFLERSQNLRDFIRRRVRSKAEAADLAQEVYLRLLRVKEPEAIRNPEGYLYGVASNLIREQRLLEQRRSTHDDASDPSLAAQLAELPSFDSELDSRSRQKRLLEVLMQLPPNCRTAVVLQYRDGLSYEEIGDRLGISTHMVKKHLTHALAHCRKRMGRWA